MYKVDFFLLKWTWVRFSALAETVTSPHDVSETLDRHDPRQAESTTTSVRKRSVVFAFLVCFPFLCFFSILCAATLLFLCSMVTL